MKLLSSYIKEMKIAARGFYFYVEIVMAVIILAILLLLVNEEPAGRTKEFLFYDMPQEVAVNIYESDIAGGKVKALGDTEFDMKAVSFEVTNEETGSTRTYEFEKEMLSVKAYELYDSKTGRLAKTVYVTESEEDMIRLARSEKVIGAKISMSDAGGLTYTYYNQGYETDRYINLLYVIHNKSEHEMTDAFNSQKVRRLGEFDMLNNRENLIPMFIVFMGALMGFFIVVAYIFNDKAEGVIRAFAVTPSPVWKYLLSKVMVVVTTVILSSSIIVIPIMGGKPDYLLMYLLLIISSFAFASLGLLAASFFETMTKSFGILFALMLAMLVPALSYTIPGFDPVWLRFFPTYPLLQGFKEIIMADGDSGYVLTFCGVFMAGGILLFLLANQKFRRTLTV